VQNVRAVEICRSAAKTSHHRADYRFFRGYYLFPETVHRGFGFDYHGFEIGHYLVEIDYHAVENLALQTVYRLVF